jgi:small-conductance mechanosensitive channel
MSNQKSTSQKLIYGIFLFVCLFLLSRFITLPAEGTIISYIKKGLDLTLISLFCICSYFILRLGEVLIKDKLRPSHPRIDELSPPVVGQVICGLATVFIAILCLQNFTSINLSPVIAALGLSGLAVALASRDTVSNLFGAVTIIFDRPFVIGERVTISGYTGVVEEIRLRSTLIRTIQGSLITIPNQRMIDSPIENLSRTEQPDSDIENQKRTKSYKDFNGCL